MTTQTLPVPLRHSQRPQPLRTAVASGRDELPPSTPQIRLDRSHKITPAHIRLSPSAARALPTFDKDSIGSPCTSQELQQCYPMLVICTVSYPVLLECWPTMDTYVHLRMHVGGTDEQMPTAHPSAELASSCDIVEQYARILYVAFVFLVTEMF